MRLRLLVLAVLAGALVAGEAHALKGNGAVYALGGVTGTTGVVFARERLACNGTTDDRGTLAALVVAGGEWAGKAVIFDGQCDALFSTCTTGSGDCTAVDVAPGTALLGEPGATIKLAARVCVGGNTPGAACPGGAGDCNGGTCTYDTGSHAFAHTTAATYTVFRTPANALCSAAATPWPCCTGSTLGLCDLQPQDVVIDGLTIAARQVEDYGRCTNGSTENGKACKGYCSASAALANWSCSEDPDCIGGGTCVGSALCPGANGDCDGASLSPAGTGAIVLVDASGSAGVTVSNLRATDHLKGKGILAGINATIEDNDLMAVAGSTWTLPLNAFPPIVYYPSQVSYAVTHGIQAAGGAFVARNRVRATQFGIDIAATDHSGATLALLRVGEVEANTVRAAGDGAVGMRVRMTGGTVEGNRVDVDAGDFTFGIVTDGSGVKARSNQVTLGPATDTDGVGIELGSTQGSGGNNAVSVLHTTRATGIRVGSATGSCFPNCTDGYRASTTGDNVSVGSGVAFELFGQESKLIGAVAELPNGGQGVGFGENSQQIVDAFTLMSGNVGVGATDRKFCNGGANDGRICKEGTSTGATCTGGACTFDDFGSNATIANSRIAFQDTVGVYGFTGLIASNLYLAWQTGRGLVLGDDRTNTGLTAGHFAITGGLYHGNAANVSLIALPDPNGVCTGSTAPLPCCTGSGTGTCAAGAVGKGTISGVEFISTNFSNIRAIDFTTGFDANSPDVTEIQIGGNQCNNSSTGSVCVAFPSSNQSKITNVSIGQNGTTSATFVANWSWAMGRIEHLVQRFMATGKTLPTTGTTANFFPIVGLATVGTTESAMSSNAPAGAALAMTCHVNAAPSTPTRILTLRKAGADTAVTCTVASGATSCSVRPSPVAYTGGQSIAMQANKAAGTATANDVTCMIEYGVDP